MVEHCNFVYTPIELYPLFYLVWFVLWFQYLNMNYRAGRTPEAENFGIIAIIILASLVFALAFTDDVVISGIVPLLWFG